MGQGRFFFFKAPQPSITTLVEKYTLDWVSNGLVKRTWGQERGGPCV